MVATAIEALLLHPAVSDELDETAIADFLVHNRYSDFAATAFAAVRRLPPAHLLVWRDGNVSVRRYWRQPEWEPIARLPRARGPRGSLPRAAHRRRSPTA